MSEIWLSLEDKEEIIKLVNQMPDEDESSVIAGKLVKGEVGNEVEEIVIQKDGMMEGSIDIGPLVAILHIPLKDWLPTLSEKSEASLRTIIHKYENQKEEAGDELDVKIRKIIEDNV